MKITTLVLLAAVAVAVPSASSAQDRSSDNRAAVRRMFPIVSIFDKKKQAAAESARTEAGADAVAPAVGGDPLALMQALATNPGDTRDVAGIRLGMTQAEATAAATRAGYARIETKTQYGWASNIRQEEDNRSLPKLYPASATPVPGTETFKGSGSQKLTIEYTPTARGTYVYSVRYSVNMSETPWDTMKERTRAKYGRESYANASKLVFCLKGDTGCDAFAQYSRPNIELDYMVGSSWLTLAQGKQYRDAYQRARNAEVDRLHPKNDRPAF